MYLGVVGFLLSWVSLGPWTTKCFPCPSPPVCLLPLDRGKMSLQLCGWNLRGLFGVFEFSGIVLGVV